ncbi:MAG: hypothetical protein GC184_10460 [Rhizobiales bacterium]|nr:hypothetical protein [Hyphomicrobiales bacterium]
MIPLKDPIFRNETRAREYFEKLRWRDGRQCPHCGEGDKTVALHGQSHREGLYYCNNCKGQFTATVGTPLEGSKVPLHKWLLAHRLLNDDAENISVSKMHRIVGVSYKTAWLMAQRLQAAAILGFFTEFL